MGLKEVLAGAAGAGYRGPEERVGLSVAVECERPSH